LGDWHKRVSVGFNNMRNYLQFLLLVLVLTMCLSLETAAQIKQTFQFEREQKNSDQEFILISMKEDGLVLVRDKEKFKEGNQLWEIIRLDTDLKEVWNVELDIENRMKLVGYEYKNDLVYLLYRQGDHEASDLALITIQIQSQEINRYTIKQELSFRVTHFIALEKSIALGGYVSNEPAILLYDLGSEIAKLVPGFFVSDAELLDLRTNTNNTFNTLLAMRSNKQSRKLILKTYDASGALILEDEMDIDTKRTILSGITSTLIHDELFITGTWTEGVSKQASGIYTTLVDPFSDQIINYYDFGQFDHFLDFNSKKRVAKIKLRSQQASKSGKIPDFKTYAIPMRLEENPGGFSLLTEVYLPSTSLNSNPYWNNSFNAPYYGNYSPYGYNPFMNRYYSSPYQFNTPQTSETKMLYSSLIIFNPNGKRIIDYGLKIEDKKVSGLEQATDFVLHNNRFALALKKEKEAIFLSGKIDDQVETDTLATELTNPGERIRNESAENSAIRFWYENNFYLWGYQNIRDRSRSEDHSRYVFYINKIEVR